MSYDISLHCPVTGNKIHFDTPHEMRGGTYALGGTTEATLNITWNYSNYYYEVFPKGIREIYGKSGAESIPMFRLMTRRIRKKYKSACRKRSKSYWDATPGNALKPLYQLIAMAKMRPDGIWRGD